MIPSSIQSLSYIKRKANSTIEQQNIKVTKNVIDFQFRKWKLIIRFPSEIKVLRIDPVFSNWVNFNKKVPIINCSLNSKSFKAICFFFFQIQKLKVFEKKCQFFFQVPCVHCFFLTVKWLFFVLRNQAFQVNHVGKRRYCSSE